LKKLLIIDDSQVVCAHIASCLKGAKFDIKFAYSGKEALSEFSSFQPEVIVVDINIPPPDGLDCVRRFRKAGSQAKILMISSMSDNEYALDSIEAGAQSFLSKPFSRNELTAAISRLLQ